MPGSLLSTRGDSHANAAAGHHTWHNVHRGCNCIPARALNSYSFRTTLVWGWLTTAPIDSDVSPITWRLHRFHPSSVQSPFITVNQTLRLLVRRKAVRKGHPGAAQRAADAVARGAAAKITLNGTQSLYSAKVQPWKNMLSRGMAVHGSHTNLEGYKTPPRTACTFSDMAKRAYQGTCVGGMGAQRDQGAYCRPAVRSTSTR